jgi:hypothetical protein
MMDLANVDRGLAIIAFFFTTVHVNEQIPTTAKTEAKSRNVSLILIRRQKHSTVASAAQEAR